MMQFAESRTAGLKLTKVRHVNRVIVNSLSKAALGKDRFAYLRLVVTYVRDST